MRELNEGDEVRVVKSQDVLDLGLKGLIDRTGIIVEVCRKGCWIRILGKLPEPIWEGEKEWFIPNFSIEVIKKYKSEPTHRCEGDIEIVTKDGVTSVISK